MVCEEDADGGETVTLCRWWMTAGLAACLGFGGGEPLAVAACREDAPQAPQIPVHMSMSVPASSPAQSSRLDERHAANGGQHEDG